MFQPDDPDDFPPDPRPRLTRKPVVSVVVILAGVAVMALAVCGGVVALLWMRTAPEKSSPEIQVEVKEQIGGADARQVTDRDVFTRRVVGLDPNGVRNSAGQPTSIQENEPITWHYAGRTRDTATGHIDRDTIVIFENGRVKEVRFAPADAH
jgi:hypothetical protein